MTQAAGSAYGDVMHGPPWRHRSQDRPVDLGPAVIAAVVTVLAAGRWSDDVTALRQPDAVAYGLLLLAAAALTVRKVYPAPVIALTTVVAIVYPQLGYPANGVFLLPLIIAVFSAMARGRRVPAVAGVAVYLVAFVVLGVLPGEVGSEGVLSVPVWLGATLLAGEGARNRRAFFAEAHQRATETQRTREEEAKRRAGEERIRIAREVHDVVSHSIAMINVQAGVAAHLLDDDPEQARTALVAIRDASRDALRDLRTTLGVLRDVDADVDDRTPTPGLARLDDLMERTRTAGLDVEVERTGTVRPLLAGVDVAAYRIVQEAVSNVLRHAGASTVTIGIDHGTDVLTVEVVDDGAGDTREPGRGVPTTVEGNGIRGMHERAAALGGIVETGPASQGGFRVTARLPLEAAQ
ncbi:sensor histidine kinase [soil metagenome]